MALSESQARALRLKRADRVGDIANAQADIDAIDRELAGQTAPTDPVVTPPKASVLPPIAGPLTPNAWGNPWTPSDWDEPKMNGYRWSPNNVFLDGTDLKVRLTEKNSAQIQQNGAARSDKGRWEVDVTLAAPTPGMIQAPLWTYNNETRDELDFEWVGANGLHLTVYAKGVAVWSKTIANVKDGRHHIAVEYEAGKSVIFIMDGVELDRVTPAQTKGGAFPTSPMKAYIEVWPSLSEGWAGKWQGAGSGLTMTVHGFRQS